MDMNKLYNNNDNNNNTKLFVYLNNYQSTAPVSDTTKNNIVKYFEVFIKNSPAQ